MLLALFLVFVVRALTATAQDLPPVSAASDYARLRDGINPPKLLHSFDPQYTPQAVAGGIEGSVVLQAVIDVKGNVAYASVVSPLPAGLDAQALASVKRWKYSPAVMDGEVIPVLTTIDVLFRLPYRTPDPVVEERRKAFEQIMLRLGSGRTPLPGDVREIKDLASHGFVAAIGILGELLYSGSGMPKDEAGGLAKLKQAAGNDNARALFILGRAMKDWKMLEKAAFLGNAEAQEAVAEKEDSKHYFRLCAASGHAVCEYRLGQRLVTGPDVNPDDFAQGVAWLELAKERGNREAAELYATSFAKLSSLQVNWVAGLKPHLELKNFHGF